MKIVAKRDEAEGELVTVKYSPAARRHKSKDRGSAKADLMTAVVRTKADTPDDIFDMFERYTDETEQTITRRRSIDDRDYAARLEEGRDDVDEGEDAGRQEKEEEEYQHTRQDEQSGDYILNLIDRLRLPEIVGQRQREETQCKSGEVQSSDYIVSLIDKLRLRDVVEHIQAYPTTKQAREAKQDFQGQFHENAAYTSQINELKTRLEQEGKTTRGLERNLEQSEKMHREERLILQKKNAELELRLGLQDSAYNDRLTEEQNKSRNLEELLKLKSESEAPPVETERFREWAQDLEKEASNLRNKNASLEATLEARQSYFDFYITSANNKIRELEQSQADKTNIAKTERAQSKNMELSLAKTETMFEVDRKKMRTLQLTDAKNVRLLETERKRSEALEQLNEKMKLAMKKLSKKALLLDGAQQQISALTRELEKRGKVMSSIKRILNVNEQAFPRLLHGEEPATIELLVNKEFSTYSKGMDTSQDSDLASTNPVIKPRKERDGHEHRKPQPKMFPGNESQTANWDE
jgi:hypothetical protein